MTRDAIARQARLIIARELCILVGTVREAADFRADLGADSLDMVTLPRALEEEFGVRFSDREVEFCQTVGTAIDLVETKLENRGIVQ